MNKTDHQMRVVEIAAKITGEMLRTSHTRLFLSEVAKELINAWASKGGIRKKVATPVKWAISKTLKPDGKPSPETLSGAAGELITAWSRKVNAEHSVDPVCHSHTRSESIHAFLANTDFGEIREMIDGSQQCFLKMVEAFNENLWKYPAKVASILATLLAAVNTGIRAAREILKPIEKNVGPDLLADLILSLLKGLDARETGELVNAVSEFIRRLHTGNLLLSKAGKPLFQLYLATQLQEALPGINPVLVRKARIALAEGKEAISRSLCDALSENPGLLLEMVSAYGSMKTPSIRGTARKVHVYEEADQEALSEAVSRGLSGLDTYEIAEAINGFLRVINRIHENRPDVFSNIMRSVTDSVDPELVRTTSRWLVPEVVETARPIFTAAMPQLLKALCEMIRPPDALPDRDHLKAVLALRDALFTAGGEG